MRLKNILRHGAKTGAKVNFKHYFDEFDIFADQPNLCVSSIYEYV